MLVIVPTLIGFFLWVNKQAEAKISALTIGVVIEFFILLCWFLCQNRIGRRYPHIIFLSLCWSVTCALQIDTAILFNHVEPLTNIWMLMFLTQPQLYLLLGACICRCCNYSGYATISNRASFNVDASRISREELPQQRIDLYYCVAEALMNLESKLEEQQATIQVEEPLATVTANRTIVVQIITNLLTNAIKFVTPEVQPIVRIRTEFINDKVRLWIEDNGIGIPQKYQERIFNVFTRLHSKDKYPGTGIGLAIVRKGAEQMNATIGVESQPGQGSKFWIEFTNS